MSIESVKSKHENELMDLPNVVGVGIGQREGKEVIKVFVTRRVPESSLRPEEIIPKSLEEWETEIEEIGAVTAEP